MIARDLTLPTRKAILTLLKADAALTARVPAARIFPQAPGAQPAWPFIRYGAPVTSPVRASCGGGSEIDVALHVFAKGSDAKSAEDEAAEIAALIPPAIERTGALAEGGPVRITWLGTQIIQDGDEADAFHAIVRVRAKALA